MTKEYTEMIENNYPSYMGDMWKDYAKHLERELRRARVKIVELEKKAQAQEPKSAEEVSK